MIPKYLKHSILHYWYTGEKKIAITGFIIGSLINLLFLLPILGENIIIIIIILLMDYMIFILLIIYLLQPSWIHLDVLDTYFIKYFISVAIGWLVNRFITNFLAERYFKYKL